MIETRGALNLIMITATCLLVACGSVPAPRNYPLEATAEPNTITKSSLSSEADSPLFVAVAMSGGGVRSAAFSNAVLRELTKLKYQHRGAFRSITDDIRIISAVSGGSVPAAWYGLRGNEGIEEIRSAFLSRDNMWELWARALNPLTWLRSFVTDSNRSDLLIEHLDDRLFRGTTYGDIFSKQKAPLIVLNATDMASGARFTFSQDTFDEMCSDLRKLKLAVAVTASAAVPLAMAPITITNYSSEDCRLRLASTLSGKRSKAARRLTVTHDMKYIHLLDGGLADNLGLRSLISQIEDNFQLTFRISSNKAAKNPIEHLIIISVNAKVMPPSDLYRQSSTPGIASMFGSVISDPINSASESTGLITDAYASTLASRYSEIVRENAESVREFGEDGSVFDAPESVDYIQFDFQSLDTSVPEERALLQRLNAIPTTWSIEPSQLADLERAAEILVQGNNKLKRILEIMSIKDANAVRESSAD